MSAGRLVLVAFVAALACEATHAPDQAAERPFAPTHEEILVEPRSHLLPTYPCTSCHDEREAQPTRRRLADYHRTRYDDLKHGDDAFWCYQCHALEDIDKLRMASGQLISFDEAWRLCTSCHGDKQRDFQRGIHGLTIGEWNGKKYRRSCTGCHDPHNPRFRSMTPEKPPAPVQSR